MRMNNYSKTVITICTTEILLCFISVWLIGKELDSNFKNLLVWLICGVIFLIFSISVIISSSSKLKKFHQGQIQSLKENYDKQIFDLLKEIPLKEDQKID